MTVVIETDVVEVQVDNDGATSHVNNYTIQHMLGQGTFSKVYLAKNGKDEEYKVQREVAIMKKLAHNNLVKLHEVIDNPADDTMFLVLELIRGGQLMHWDDKNFRYRADTATGLLDKEDVRNCIRDVVSALSYLHHNQICHRDVKPENILVADDHLYKLADFGVAHMHSQDEKKFLRSTEGTYHFLAPECTTGNEYDPYLVDIWALGVTMFAMLVGSLPFGSKAASLTQVMDSIREDRLEIPSNIDTECVELMTRMMEKDPSQRITIAELQSHPWLIENTMRERQESVVQVSEQEIEDAFTPVNNFILTTKLKMKMSSRLAKARMFLVAKNESPKHGIDMVQPITNVYEHLPNVEISLNDAPRACEQSQAPRACEQSQGSRACEQFQAPPQMRPTVKKRKSSLHESLNGAKNGLASISTLLTPTLHSRKSKYLEMSCESMTPIEPSEEMVLSTTLLHTSTREEEVYPTEKLSAAVKPLPEHFSPGSVSELKVWVDQHQTKLPLLDVHLSPAIIPTTSPTTECDLNDAQVFANAVTAKEVVSQLPVMIQRRDDNAITGESGEALDITIHATSPERSLVPQNPSLAIASSTTQVQPTRKDIPARPLSPRSKVPQLSNSSLKPVNVSTEQSQSSPKVSPRRTSVNMVSEQCTSCGPHTSSVSCAPSIDKALIMCLSSDDHECSCRNSQDEHESDRHCDAAAKSRYRTAPQLRVTRRSSATTVEQAKVETCVSSDMATAQPLLDNARFHTSPRVTMIQSTLMESQSSTNESAVHRHSVLKNKDLLEGVIRHNSSVRLLIFDPKKISRGRVDVPKASVCSIM